MKVIIQPNAKKDLRKLPKNIIEAVLKKLYSIKENPLAHIERLKGGHLWKLRTGDYRSILFIDTKNQEIHVLKICHRKKIYKRFLKG